MNKLNSIPFAKAHGNGNDTILFIRENCSEIISNPGFIKKICKRRTGIGADCVIIISKTKKYDFKMDYYNSDGTWETFCANGARCAVKYLNKKKLIENSTTFIAGDGEHEAKININTISIKMRTPKLLSNEIKVNNFKGQLIDSGAQHFCIHVKDINKLDDIEKLGRKIRNSKIFMPKGVNVNFVEFKKTNLLNVCTYEKGVEKIMLSCGSGSIASAFYLSKNNIIDSPMESISDGGKLIISFNDTWSDVWIKGEAKILFESKFSISDL